MVVLDEHARAQVEAVVARPAHAHRIFLQQAEARRGFARVRDAQAGAGGGVDERTRQGCNSRQALHEIQGGTFGGQERGRVADVRGKSAANRHLLAVLGQFHNRNRAVDAVEDFRANPESRQHQWLASDEMGRGGCVLVDDGLGRDIAPAEVFL